MIYNNEFKNMKKETKKKVLAAIQILGADAKASLHRHTTEHEALHEAQF